MGDKLSIFVSHKHKDKAIAHTIKDELEKYGPNRLEFFLSEGIPFGEEWSNEIHQALTDSDWLFLLYTDPAAEWDWCLYEAGFFAAKEKRRLICLLSAGLKSPGPMRRWRAVQAVEEDWIKLLGEMFGEPPRDGVLPVNPKLANSLQDLKLIATKIVQVVGRKPTSKHYNKYLHLLLELRQVEALTKTEQVPDGTPVESVDESLRMFGLKEKDFGRWTWGDLIKDLSAPEEIGWTKNLGIQLKNAALDRDFDPCLPRFQSPKTHMLYRPVIYRRDRMPGESLRFKIAFVEIPSEEDPRPLGDLGTISALLTIARKFRWAILIPFLSRIGMLRSRKASDEQVAVCLEELELALQKIESEAASLKFFDTTLVLSALKSKEDKDTVNEMFKEWGVLRRELMEKIEARHLDGVANVLETVREMNKTFMVLSAKRYHELLQDM